MLELIVVLAIAMIISAMAMPMVLSTIRHYQLETTTRNVQNTLMQARYAAVGQNTRICTIYVDQTVGTPVGPALPHPPLFGLDINCNGQLDAGESFLPLSTYSQIVTSSTNVPDMASMGASYASAVGSPLHGMTLVGTACSTSPQSPVFGPLGTVVQYKGSGTGCATVTTGGGSWIEATSVYVILVQHTVTQQWSAITVTPAGRFRVWYWNGNAWTS